MKKETELMETNVEKKIRKPRLAAPGEPLQATYETLMAELAVVMKTMENSTVSLEEQLVNYEKGMKLCRDLETMLKTAEERISIINQAGVEEEFE